MKKELKKSSNRSFGILFFVVFLIIGIFPILDGEKIRIWSIVISALFLLLGFFNSGVLTPLNNFWVKIGIVLGKLISPIIMGIIFFIVVTPIGIFMKLIGKDLIKIKKSKKPTFWIEKKNYNSTMKDQF
tara:strand:+ start:1652 stop:2038 length:387 start_codon:yes stop_codon:yes gene_type:complete